jgi:hypothetical protein
VTTASAAASPSTSVGPPTSTHSPWPAHPTTDSSTRPAGAPENLSTPGDPALFAQVSDGQSGRPGGSPRLYPGGPRGRRPEVGQALCRA